MILAIPPGAPVTVEGDCVYVSPFSPNVFSPESRKCYLKYLLHPSITPGNQILLKTFLTFYYPHRSCLIFTDIPDQAVTSSFGQTSITGLHFLLCFAGVNVQGRARRVGSRHQQLGWCG